MPSLRPEFISGESEGGGGRGEGGRGGALRGGSRLGGGGVGREGPAATMGVRGVKKVTGGGNGVQWGEKSPSGQQWSSMG